ncbi:MAG: RlpA-like double-psi beta-barrel domain-containing protein [Candidatus Falkowbacteria bacterium]
MNLKKQFKNLKQIISSALVVVFMAAVFLIPENVILALVGEGNPINLEASSLISADELGAGKTVSVFNNNLRLVFPSATSTTGFADSSEIKFTQLNEEIGTPWNLNKLSHVYQFDFGSQVLPKTFNIEVGYQEKQTIHEYKQVFFYDKNNDSWKPLPTTDHPDKNYVSAVISMPYARIAVLSYPGIIVSGKASWYAYKGGLFTASPDFPKGSKLRVYNLANNKFVDVIVNDYGPERLKHPDRAVDLDKVAFKKIASTGAGIINVRVEPLEVKADSSGRVMGVPAAGATVSPALSSKAAIVMRESDQKVIFSKNSTTTLPLASLSKMVAVKTFLDIDKNRNRLAEVVSYKLQDEKNNYNYCKPWESAKLSLKDGDKLTIKDLIYSSLVGSTNNTVESLARVSGVSRAKFISLMNENVKAWGTKNTSFVEPTGLSPKNVSSALDYALITKRVNRDGIIAAASSAKTYNVKVINTKKVKTIKNTNSLLGLSKYNISSSKTGYLDEAGYCLMTRFKEGKENLIAVTFNAKNRTASFNETAELMSYSARLIRDGKVGIASVK